ncbi:MAG: iron-sulfur cluster assembly accessory protein [Euryarchaeota archaeon]|jgi:iron-sulfur cluster assembly accessory protein|nr:iron-sulfur cluster assembly accessory protein [Euryarchaeota archaeon]MBT5994294.1 iron-sulfur cluster assembly accessory protein [Candidatus Neomarinimicrobiota bacterium]MBT3757487.1 iron-sulfur cluster assembly accessory protein [Euryarchaeota archaeon]MBT4050580.1 iron-sulfur cluster assembly accessory protein [Euryarchaeota archaeon]MBT4650712.1 iron-sulfur cluster assembly accessory protein [Euryarchaeota archaeon]|tara:strand:+ start:5168 stop:5557 length:390 start_codon:yes stop_codon:yes gene_type:complete
MGILGGDGFSLPIVANNPIIPASITVTDSALAQMKKTLENEESTHCLIISAQSGGCSGYVYDMKIDENPKDNIEFQILLFDDIRIYIHNSDSYLLNGIELDYKDSLMGGGFNIANPNASRECGCGQSFG